MQKGLVFTLMVFLIISSLLSLNYFYAGQEFSISLSQSESNAFIKTENKYQNLKNNLIRLTTNEKEREVDQRILPFNYGINNTKFTLNTEMPARQNSIESYLETIKAFSVFLEDQNHSKEFDSINADINSPVPQQWGGTAKDLSFRIEPQCIQLSINDLNTIKYDFLCEDFNSTNITRHDLNITLTQVHDFNSLSCEFNGESNCITGDFNALIPLPYFELNLDQNNCSKCSLDQNTIRGHFNPEQTSTVSISCVGAGCETPELRISIAEPISIQYNGQRLDLNYTIDLNKTIGDFYYSDVNILVENPLFGIKRWS